MLSQLFLFIAKTKREEKRRKETECIVDHRQKGTARSFSQPGVNTLLIYIYIYMYIYIYICIYIYIYILFFRERERDYIYIYTYVSGDELPLRCGGPVPVQPQLRRIQIMTATSPGPAWSRLRLTKYSDGVGATATRAMSGIPSPGHAADRRPKDGNTNDH